MNTSSALAMTTPEAAEFLDPAKHTLHDGWPSAEDLKNPAVFFTSRRLLALLQDNLLQIGVGQRRTSVTLRCRAHIFFPECEAGKMLPPSRGALMCAILPMVNMRLMITRHLACGGRRARCQAGDCKHWHGLPACAVRLLPYRDMSYSYSQCYG